MNSFTRLRTNFRPSRLVLKRRLTEQQYIHPASIPLRSSALSFSYLSSSSSSISNAKNSDVNSPRSLNIENQIPSSFYSSFLQNTRFPSLGTIQDYSDIFWHSKIPKGFENFFPKDGNVTSPEEGGKKKNIANENELSSPSEKEKNSSSSGEKKNQSARSNSSGEDKSSKDKKRKKKQQHSIPPPHDDIPNQNIPGMLALLLLIMGTRSLYESDQVDGKEITFVEFRNQLLLSGQVERVEVINQQIARVVLKPDATGISTSALSSSTTSFNDSSMNTMGVSSNSPMNSSGQIRAAPQSQNGQWNDEDISTIEWNNNESSTLGPNNPNRKKSPTVYYFYIGTVESFEEKLSAAQQQLHPSRWVEVNYITKTNWALEFIKSLPSLAFVGTVYFLTKNMSLMGRGGAGGGSGGGGGGIGSMFNVGKSNAKKIKPEDVSTTFADVAGCQQAKQEVMEFVDFLKDSERFTKLGARIPKGALLCGPPGTGKTLLGKAVAGEAGVPFYSISGSDFIEMFVGVGPSRVRDLFKEARANAPCIVFIDEIDAVGRQRGRGGFSGGNDERENTLNQLLVEMDGFEESAGVVVLAGTNRVDILDQALTRPGRFDRQILVDAPDIQGRKEIFKIHLKGVTLENDTDQIASRLAGLTPGFTGADISNICNEAAIVAARREADAITMDDFEKATDRVIGGLESNKIMSKEERSIVAYHEAGHAIAGWFLEHADPLLKVTILPRASGALGFAQYLPREVFLRTQEQILDIVAMALAGRAAEEVFFGKVTTGASNDLQRVTQLVYSMIQTYGMNSRVGQLGFPEREGGTEKPYSDYTAEAMDDEAREIVNAAYDRTLNLIRDHKEDLDKVAKLLLEKETITHDDVVDLIGERPFEGDDQYKEYVSRRKSVEDLKESTKEDKQKDMSEDSDGNETNDNSGLTPGIA